MLTFLCLLAWRPSPSLFLKIFFLGSNALLFCTQRQVHYYDHHLNNNVNTNTYKNMYLYSMYLGRGLSLRDGRQGFWAFLLTVFEKNGYMKTMCKIWYSRFLQLDNSGKNYSYGGGKKMIWKEGDWIMTS